MATHPFGVPPARPTKTENSGSNTSDTHHSVHRSQRDVTGEKFPTRVKASRSEIGIAIVLLVFIGSLSVLIWNAIETGRHLDRHESRISSLEEKIADSDTGSGQLKPTRTLPQKAGSTLPLSSPAPLASLSRASEATPMPLTAQSRTTEAAISQLPTDTGSPYAFNVLQTNNVTYRGYNFLAVQVQLPSDGLSRSENWCRDYQYMCESFQRRPTGCTGYPENFYSPFKDCRDEYNSDMSLTHGLLRCSPTGKIADLANTAFPNVSIPAQSSYNSFGFYKCKPEYCQNTTEASGLALTGMTGFWKLNETDVVYTVCH